MSTGKVKNLVIVALLMLNAFLAVFFIWGRAGELSVRREILEDICAIMRNNGIGITPSAIDGYKELASYGTSRDTQGEDALAAAVLGQAERTESGIISRYAGQHGTATFNGRGEFVVDIYPGEITAPDASARTRELLKSMGLSTGALTITRSGAELSVSAVCTFEGAPVFNCPVRFDYTDGSLIRVSGRRADALRDTADVGISAAAEALLVFLAYVKSEAIPCGEITRAEPGYQFNVGAVGDGELSPGWLISADAGEFFVYSGDGTVERAGISG
jgi:hypothetical protein